MLTQHGGILGGETSGHILCLDQASTGDGIVSALQVLEVLRRHDGKLASLREGLKKVPQHTANLRIAAGVRPTESSAVQALLGEAQRALAGRGRAFMRPSGTEPVVRVTVEAADAAEVQHWVERLSDAVRAAC
jgi:phosphoglucosamine mutase